MSGANSYSGPSRWGRTEYYLFGRIAILLVGFAAQLLAIREIPVKDFTVVAVCLGTSELLVAVLGFGWASALNREIAYSPTPGRVRELLGRTLSRDAIYGTATALAILFLAGVTRNLTEGSLITDGLLTVAFLPLLSVALNHMLGAMRGLQLYGNALAVQAAGAVARLAGIALLTPYLGVQGMLISASLAEFVAVIAASATVWTWLSKRSHEAIPEPLAPDSSFLQISRFSYANNLSATAWARLPFIFASFVLPEHIVGAATVAQRLARRIGLLGDVATSLKMPKLTKILSTEPDLFPKASLKASAELAGLTILAGLLLYLGWNYAAPLAVSGENVDRISPVLAAFILIQLMDTSASILRGTAIMPLGVPNDFSNLLIWIRMVGLFGFSLAVAGPVPSGLVLPLSFGAVAAAILLIHLVKTRSSIQDQDPSTTQRGF